MHACMRMCMYCLVAKKDMLLMVVIRCVCVGMLLTIVFPRVILWCHPCVHTFDVSMHTCMYL
jgi:hypothetical protein